MATSALGSKVMGMLHAAFEVDKVGDETIG